MDTTNYITLGILALTGFGLYVRMREAVAELKTGFAGVLSLLEKQDQRITFMEQRSMRHHPLKDEN